MSNSPLINYTKISPHRSSRNGNKIDMVIIHCVVGQCAVETLGSLFQSKAASANYGIGYDGRVGMYVEESERAWCSGGVDENGKAIRVNGISGADIDRRAVSIECACDAYAPYKVNDKVYSTLINLLTDICKRNDIKELKWQGDKSLVGNVAKQNMAVHRWFAYKSCPGDYLYNRHGEIAAAVNKKLMEDDDMDIDRFKELWREMRKELQDNDASAYSEEARKWAVDNGIVLGKSSGEFNGMWEDMMTREQLVTVLYRFAQKFGLS